MKTAHLSNRALVSINGDMAVEFLQNLITCDVDGLKEGEAGFGGLLTPQGKILFDFFCIRTGQGFLFDIASELQADFIKRMTFYKLRTPVEISAVENGNKIFAAWDGNKKPDMDDIDIEDGHAYFDPRAGMMGIRIITVQQQVNSDLAEYNSHRIAVGMPQGSDDFAYGNIFPHDAMMDQFETAGAGVAFQKGCYVGQEVVSRMQHRGTARRRIVMISANQPLPPFGSAIEANGKSIGTVGSVDDCNGLAMVRIDRLVNALGEGTAITSEDIELEAKMPDWTKLTLKKTPGG